MVVRKLLSIPEELWQGVQNWRFTNKVDTSTEAVRQLLTIALVKDVAKCQNDVKHDSNSEIEVDHPFAA